MTPKLYEDTLLKMKSILYSATYSKDVFEPSIAYTYTRTQELCGTVYKMTINDKDKKLAQYLFMHEAGHILCGHTKNMDTRMDLFLQSKISAAFTKIAHYFDDYQEYLHIFTSLVFNVVMDFEVNSSLYSDEEWEFMNERVALLTKEKGARGMWPEDYGYPKNLTWNNYLTLILMEPEQFMNNFRSIIKQKIKANIGNRTTPMTEKEYEEIRNAMDSGSSTKLTQKEMEEIKRISEEHSSGTFEEQGGNNSPKNSFGRGHSKYYEIEFSQYHTMNELLAQILKVLQLKKEKHLGNRDILYNYNRRKHSSNVIIPKDRTRDVRVPGRLYILIDVSGSVDPRLVHNLAMTFQQIKDNYRSIKFTTWDTDLIAEWDINSPVIDRYGGGTNIAKGIDYVASKYKPTADDTFFVVSDFIDIMEEWKKSLKNIEAKKYAINWEGDSEMDFDNPGFKHIFKYTEDTKH